MGAVDVQSGGHRKAPYPWQASQWEQLLSTWQAGRLPHAVLLQGPRGLGKEALARSLIDLVLEGKKDDSERVAGTHLTHPDFLPVLPAEGKTSIAVEQIRALGEYFSLKSHQGGSKCALISPAQRMTTNAANSLLKTLEEPAGSTLLVLTSPSISALPATIISRCLRIRFSIPPRNSALGWLESQQQRHDWARLLDFASGAPLSAYELAQNDFSALESALTDDLLAIIEGTSDPAQIAAGWSRAPAPSIQLAWLRSLTCGLIRSKSTATPSGHLPKMQKYIRTIKIQNLFEYLDEVYRVTEGMETSMNAQLAFESLLIPWCRRLGNSRSDHTI